MAAAKVCVPSEPQVWVHPENAQYVYAWNLPQLRVGKAFDVREASRELVLEWIYRNIWKRHNLGGISKNTEAIAVLLKMFMFFPTRRVTFMIQRVIRALGKYTIRSSPDDAIDGIFDDKTRGAIYTELCNRYEPARMALYAEVYSELQSQGAGDEALWAPILQAYVTQRI